MDEARVATLIRDRADSIIRKILRHRLGNSDAQETDDLHASIVLRLLRRLGKIDAGDAEPIENFEQYVAMISRHAVDDFLRARFPERVLLKNRLRYLFTHDGRFAMWSAGGKIVCGLAAWSGRDAIALLAQPRLDVKNAVSAVAQFFDEQRAPVELDALVSLFAVPDARPHVVEDVDPSPSILERLSIRDAVERLLREVEALPPRQRAALLLHLRDEQGTSMLPLLAVTGAVTTERIAALVSMTNEELAAAWDELPFDDHRIAARLGATRQQVINLRKSARERLARRTRR